MIRLENDEPAKVARTSVHRLFTRNDSTKTLRHWRNEWWQWDRHWNLVSDDRVKQRLWTFLEDATFTHYTRSDVTEKRYVPSQSKIKDVMEAVKMLVLLDADQTAPFWLVRSDIDPHRLVSFNDCIVDLNASRIEPIAGDAPGSHDDARAVDWQTLETDPMFFDVSRVPVDFDPDAQCPLWHRCLAEWSAGDPAWVSLLQRWMGYCLMGHRRYAKWLLMYGKVRGGKGTIADVLRAMLGHPGYISVSLEDLANDFGMDGLEFSRVIDIREVSKTTGGIGARTSRIIKNAVGGDPITINVKHVRQRRGAVLGAAPMMQSNLIPILPNEGRGLTSKMLVLPFNQSFEGRENWTLKEDLKDELAGIAVWALRGALDLESTTDHRLKWPVPREARAVVDNYHIQNNPIDQFLEACFIRSEEGFVPVSYIWAQWQSWSRENRVNTPVTKYHLRNIFLEQSSWDLSLAREGTTGVRGLRGLAVRHEVQESR